MVLVLKQAVTDINGIVVRRNAKKSEALEGLPRGIYVIDGKTIRK